MSKLEIIALSGVVYKVKSTGPSTKPSVIWFTVMALFLHCLSRTVIVTIAEIIGVRDAPFDIWGGGGARVFVACKLFFLPPRKNNLFFWRSTSDNFFFMFYRRIFLSYAFPIMYVTIWCFFWSTYFSSISTTIFFFCPHFQQTFFFWLLWRQTIYFNFNLAPPPRYQMWCVPYSAVIQYLQ